MNKFLLIAVITASLLSCQQASNGTSDETTKTSNVSNNNDNIELENGNKWKVNEEMKPFVIKGQDLVANFISTGETDYIELANKIKVQNDELIKSCTMKGQSHEELHKWLHPHLDLVKELSNTKDADQANQLILKLSDSYSAYHQYFE